jgi:hypothetical protein
MRNEEVPALKNSTHLAASSRAFVDWQDLFTAGYGSEVTIDHIAINFDAAIHSHCAVPHRARVPLSGRLVNNGAHGHA